MLDPTILQVSSEQKVCLHWFGVAHSGDNHALRGRQQPQPGERRGLLR